MCIFETYQWIQYYHSTILNVKRLIRSGTWFTGFLFFTSISPLISVSHVFILFSHWHDDYRYLVLVNCYHCTSISRKSNSSHTHEIFKIVEIPGVISSPVTNRFMGSPPSALTKSVNKLFEFFL